MGVLIKGMKMPDHCWECWLMRNMICGASGELIPSSGKRKHCPLVDLGKYGRLIDADAYADRIESIIKRQGYDDFTLDRFTTVGEVLNAVIADLKGMTLYGYENAPTVIEAEEEY